MEPNSGNRDFLDQEVINRLSRLHVLPRGLVQGSFSGMHRSPHRGASVEFAEYRKYVPGDDIRHIDWRVYGRSDRFYIKEFEADTNLRCYLVVDSSASMGFEADHGTRLDYAKQLAATLAYIVVHQSDHVGLQAFNDGVLVDIRPKANPSHLQTIYQMLGDLKPSGGSNLAGVLHTLAESIRSRALVLVFSDFFTDLPEVIDCFKHMRHRKHDLAVFHLLDRAEMDFNFDRPIRFVDLEGPTSLTTDPTTIRQAYLDAMTGFTTRLRKTCREFGVDYQLAITDTPYEHVLSRFMLERAGR